MPPAARLLAKAIQRPSGDQAGSMSPMSQLTEGAGSPTGGLALSFRQPDVQLSFTAGAPPQEVSTSKMKDPNNSAPAGFACVVVARLRSPGGGSSASRVNMAGRARS